MSISCKVIVIISWNRSTHLNSKNQCIHIWYQQLPHIRNAWVVTVLKLVNSIDLDHITEYNVIEKFMDSKDSEDSKDDSWVELALIQQLTLKEMTNQDFAY